MLKRKLARNNANNEAEETNVESDIKRSKNEEAIIKHSDRDKSKYFSSSEIQLSVEEEMLKLQNALNDTLRSIKFQKPVEYVYNPVEYASKCNEAYVRKYCINQKKLLFVGMNPGPFGMCQTGVPFGEIKSVRDWLKIGAEVSKPPVECPDRPVLGFECSRTEVSGDRLWNLFKSICGTPEIMFADCFVYNYCPLAFMNSKGGNITPSELKNAKDQLEEACDKAYVDLIRLLKPQVIVSIGRYVEKRTNQAIKGTDIEVKVLCMTHPSPRVVNNNNWPEKAKKFLVDSDLIKYLKGELANNAV